MEDIKILKNQSLKDFCTFKIGGIAKYVYICNTTPALVSTIKHCKKKGIKFKVIGLGANLLFSDEGFSGAIIVNRTNKLLFRQDSVYADGGVNVTSLYNLTIVDGDSIFIIPDEVFASTDIIYDIIYDTVLKILIKLIEYFGIKV